MIAHRPHHRADLIRLATQAMTERWAHIVGVAETYGETLPDAPDAQAPEAFLAKRRLAVPLRFPDLITSRLVKAALLHPAGFHPACRRQTGRRGRRAESRRQSPRQAGGDQRGARVLLIL